jgi:hypothetical protein
MQATLTDHFQGHPEKVAVGDHISDSTKMIYTCGNCQNNKGRKGALVRCMGQWKSEPTDGCGCYSDGKELEEMARFAPPEGFVAKKYGGGE